MNDRPTASELGRNPYAPGQIGHAAAAAGQADRPVLDPRSIGLDGDVLDQLLKGRWQEGHETGYEDGHTAARQRYESIFNEGHGMGHDLGAAETRAQLAALIFPVLRRQIELLEAIVGKTGSQAIKQQCVEAAGQMRVSIEEIADVVAPGHGAADEGAEKGQPV